VVGETMRIERFQDLDSWKQSRELVREMYGALAECRDFGFRDQIQRAVISIMSNIAEGFGRSTGRERVQFFGIARGSLAEVESLCYVAKDLGYLDEERFSTFCERCESIKRLINGFIRYLKSAPQGGASPKPPDSQLETRNLKRET
jgi:four helix bundle protein